MSITESTLYKDINSNFDPQFRAYCNREWKAACARIKAALSGDALQKSSGKQSSIKETHVVRVGSNAIRYR